MTEAGFRECARVALETQGWNTNWTRDGNEAGWLCSFQPDFREKGYLEIDLNKQGTLHIVGDDRGAFVLGDRTLRRMARENPGAIVEDGVYKLPPSLAAKVFVIALKFSVGHSADPA